MSKDGDGMCCVRFYDMLTAYYKNQAPDLAQCSLESSQDKERIVTRFRVHSVFKIQCASYLGKSQVVTTQVKWTVRSAARQC